MSSLKHYLFLVMMINHLSCIAFSNTYFYQLYLHNEYYSEPPGFPSKLTFSPIITWLSGAGVDWKEKRLSAGFVETVRLAYDHSWLELIAGFGKEKVQYNHEGTIGKQSRWGWDDFLIDVGHNFIDESGKKQFLVHWLIGIPLINKVTLAEIEQPLVGTRTFGTGPVLELAYDFVRDKSEDLFVGLLVRFIHSFKRRYEPILPPDAFLIPGNFMNILALIHYRYYEHNLEAGYVYTTYNNMSYQFPGYRTPLPSQEYKSIYIDYFYFHEDLSLGFELGIVQTFGQPYNETSLFGLIAWYF